ncbi:uncharacterized protein LOC110914052 [Helianthus annuus]|uniref:uncharacterized protein LOC110914052 n=1 Tax=Helianthus annuus TaxID=4232 RepID=UPI000B90568E|nr:uncharacterized protein LOC110914052 [Helianthus annuus]
MGGPWNKIVKLIARSKVEETPLRSFFKGIPGKGDSIAFCLDPWVTCESLKDIYPRLFQIEANRRCKISDRVSSGIGQERFEWQWKRPLDPGPKSEDLIQLISLLDSFSVSDSKDKWVWLGEGSEEYSVGAVKKSLVKGRGSNNIYISRFKWCKWVPTKCNIFAWRAGLGRIPTVEALRRRNINIQDLSCGFCNEGEDVVGHLFTECLAANVVWNSISNWCRVPQIFAFSFQDSMEVHSFCGLKDPEKTIFQGLIIIACWSLWKARNEARFMNKRFKIEKVISEVKFFGFLWVRNRTKFKNLT